MTKLTALALLALCFTGYAAAQDNTKKNTVEIGDYKIENKSVLSVPHTLTIYRFTASSVTAVKRIITDIESKGFTTSTASLNGIEQKQHSTIMVFNAGKNKQPLTPSALAEILHNHVDVKSKTELTGVMPERQYTEIDDSAISIINTAQGKFNDGGLVLTQYISTNNKGNKTATFNKVGLPVKAVILNIIKAGENEYTMVLTTIN